MHNHYIDVLGKMTWLAARTYAEDDSVDIRIEEALSAPILITKPEHNNDSDMGVV